MRKYDDGAYPAILPLTRKVKRLKLYFASRTTKVCPGFKKRLQMLLLNVDIDLGKQKSFSNESVITLAFGPTDTLMLPDCGSLPNSWARGTSTPHVNNRDKLKTMDGLEFEHWVAHLFRRAGFQVEVTQASGDHGIDLVASSQGRLIAVQCKRWDGTVGEPILRDLYGAMMAMNAHSGCLVTTGSITAQAHQFAKDKPISLLDFDSVMEIVQSPDALRQRLSCP